MTTSRTRIGSVGESHARQILESRGWQFIEANWRCAAGEIDLVMRDEGFVVMVEVKVRSGDRLGAAEEAITASKGQKLLATGEWYMAEHPEVDNVPWRIDLMAITIDRTGLVVRHRHIPDAVVTG